MRRTLNHLVERLNHEYWPWYLTYLPVLPMLVWQAIRLRSAVFFSVVNPAIDMGGFFGERKSDIYDLLPADSYPATLLIDVQDSKEAIITKMQAKGLALPLIAKPDVGERGHGLLKLETETELTHFLQDMTEPYLLQSFVPWTGEYGLMFIKSPADGKVALLSITGKRFLSVTGDGKHTVRQLLMNTFRGQRQIERLDAYKKALLDLQPAKGEVITVEPVGNHCRGTVFYDASSLHSDGLATRLQTILDQTDGIYYGRMDVRAADDHALQRGELTILELNGVTGEPAHIYDPDFSFVKAWRELYRHLALLPALSAALIKQGHQPVSLIDLINRSEQHFNIRLPFIKRMVSLFSTSQPTRLPKPRAPITSPSAG